jgi:hypothetical protein
MVLFLHYLVTVPVASLFILDSQKIHPSYKLTTLKKLLLGIRMFWNTTRIKSGTVYKAHLAMALKLFEIPPEVPGVVMECGTWKGASATNLSLICRIIGRELHIYDSFEGLPVSELGDREAKYYQPGDYCGTLEEVKANIAKHGAIECCRFVKGWFNETLPLAHEPVVLAFLDVDYEASLETCVRYIWPRLVDHGYLFTDEMVNVNYCSLFYSERYWRETFNTFPPGLIGAGVGLALGEYYIGPFLDNPSHELQHANAAAYTFKGMQGAWTYFPVGREAGTTV